MKVARLSVGDKADRVLKFLLSMSNAHVSRALVQHGFTERDADEGWNRLRALSDGRLDRAVPRGASPEELVRLDRWENRWFPIARATLQYAYPAVEAYVFQNLRQTSGSQVVFSVQKFIERETDPEVGDDGGAARALLMERGLDDEELAFADALVTKLRMVAEPAEAAPAVDRERLEAAEEAVWRWYLQWSAIARAVPRTARRAHTGARQRRRGSQPRGGERRLTRLGSPSFLFGLAPAPSARSRRRGGGVVRRARRPRGEKERPRRRSATLRQGASTPRTARSLRRNEAPALELDRFERRNASGVFVATAADLDPPARSSAKASSTRASGSISHIAGRLASRVELRLRQAIVALGRRRQEFADPVGPDVDGPRIPRLGQPFALPSREVVPLRA